MEEVSRVVLSASDLSLVNEDLGDRRQKISSNLEDTIGLPMSVFKATLSSENNRKVSQSLDGGLESFWQQKKEENPFLFNESKFRLEKVEVNSNLNVESKVHLHFGITDYKSFVCTNSNANIVKNLMDEGHNLYNNQHACMSDALGICAVVTTSDGFVLFVRRSHSVFEAPGLVDFPGGHSEPEEMLRKCGKKAEEIFKVSQDDVIYEIFHSMIREVRDEINLPESSLTWPSLLCIMRNGAAGWKPHISFFINCLLTKEEVNRLYCLGGPEADESSELLFIHIKELVKTELGELNKKIGTMSACGLKTLELFLHMYKSAYVS